MSNQKLLAQSISLAMTAGLLAAAPTAHAEIQMSSAITRLLHCQTAAAAGEPDCVNNAANRYQVDMTVTVSSVEPTLPSGSTSPADPPASPVDLWMDLNDVFGPGNWTLVPADTWTCNGLTKPAGTTFTGTLCTATDLTYGRSGTASFRVEATFPNDTFPDIVVTNKAITGGSTARTIYAPAKKTDDTATLANCTTPGTTNLITNGDFSTLAPSGTSFPVGPGTQIPGAGFSSDVRLTGQGFNVYDDNKTISLVRQTTVHPFAMQNPLPGQTSVNWLRHGGGTTGGGTDAAQKFWKQQVSGLEVNRNYLLSAYVSNITPPGTAPGTVNNPKVRFYLGGEYSTDVELPIESATSGDEWRQIRAVIRAMSTSAEVGIENSQVGGMYNQLGVTGIKMVACEGPITSSGGSSTTTTPTTPTSGGTSTGGTTTTTSTPGSSSTPTTTTTDTAVTTGGGGGGGAFGFGALALLGLSFAARRRVVR